MTSRSKNVYIDKLDDTVNEHNNIYHRSIKTKPVDVKDNTYSDSIELHSSKELNIKILDLKFVIIQEFPNTEIFLLKDTHQLGLKKLL